jgi:NMD protein affecting ribosome stability and mRNA decay
MTQILCGLCGRRTDVPDLFDLCPACGIAVDRQVEASWHDLSRDCDLMGEFHAWTRQFDDSRRR